MKGLVKNPPSLRAMVLAIMTVPESHDQLCEDTKGAAELELVVKNHFIVSSSTFEERFSTTSS